MMLCFVFTFTGGQTFEATSSDYGSVNDAEHFMQRALSGPNNNITWRGDPANTVRLFRVASLASIEISEAGS